MLEDDWELSIRKGYSGGQAGPRVLGRAAFGTQVCKKNTLSRTKGAFIATREASVDGVHANVKDT